MVDNDCSAERTSGRCCAQYKALRFDPTSFFLVRNTSACSQAENSKQVTNFSVVGKPRQVYLYQNRGIVVKYEIRYITNGACTESSDTGLELVQNLMFLPHERRSNPSVILMEQADIAECRRRTSDLHRRRPDCSSCRNQW